MEERERERETNQIGTVMLASILENTKCFFRLLQLVVNAGHNQQHNSLKHKKIKRAMAHEECRRGAHLPSSGRQTVGG